MKLKLAFVCFWVSSVALAGGTLKFHPLEADKISEDRNMFTSADSEVYVLSEGSKCYKGKFSLTSEGKYLTVDYDKHVSADHCIYQPKYDPDPHGFSIIDQFGGICRPTSAESLADLSENLRDSIQQTHQIVSLSYCLEKTISYGSVLENRTLTASKAVEKKIAASNIRAPASTPEVESESNQPSEEVAPKTEAKKLTIQIASFKTPAEAATKINELGKKGLKTFSVQVHLKDTVWYRVLFGKFSTKQEAMKARATLVSKFNLKSSFLTRL